MRRSAVVAALRAGDRPWPCWVEVDLDAIAHNVQAIRAIVGPGCAVAAVVKAQAYGHGAVVVAKTALDAGATWLAVARVREGAQLRQAGVQEPILVLGPAEGPEIDMAVDLNLRPTIVNEQQAKAFSGAASASHRDVLVHVKLGTGLSRYGISQDEALHLLRKMRELPGLRLEGLYSHFATADEIDLGFARQQVRVFGEALSALKAEGADPPVVHMAASAATMALKESHFDMVRLGISLYGAYPSPHFRGRADLRPALSMHSRIARVFTLAPGDSVGYGRTFVVAAPLRAGLVPVGYADGLPRSHSSRGALLVNGRRAPLIGRVSMDQCVVDLSGCGDVEVGSPVVVIGAQGRAMSDIDSFAAISGTISYEALTSLGVRVPRVYLRDERPTAVAYLDEGTVTTL